MRFTAVPKKARKAPLAFKFFGGGARHAMMIAPRVLSADAWVASKSERLPAVTLNYGSYIA